MMTSEEKRRILVKRRAVKCSSWGKKRNREERSSVALWLSDSLACWLSYSLDLALWRSGCIALILLSLALPRWLSGVLGLLLTGSIALWLSDSITAWLFGSPAIWCVSFRVLWFSGGLRCQALLLYGTPNDWFSDSFSLGRLCFLALCPRLSGSLAVWISALNFGPALRIQSWITEHVVLNGVYIWKIN